MLLTVDRKIASPKPRPLNQSLRRIRFLGAGGAGDPRVKRVLAIRSASRLEVESVRLFDQLPVAPIDLYYRRLRGQPPLIRQVATQTNEDARSVDTQTDEARETLNGVQVWLCTLCCPPSFTCRRFAPCEVVR